MGTARSGRCINKCFSIRFYLGQLQMYTYDNLTIRAMVVYTSPADVSMPVTRCPNHSNPLDPINRQMTDAAQLDHVLWSTNKSASYEKNEMSGRVSVVTPYGQPHLGSDYVSQIYKFTCIGSCAGGINRRATSIIFFLEHDGRVIGRQSLNCRVCSCPKRDRKCQETSYMKHSLGSVSGSPIKMMQPTESLPSVSASSKKKIKLEHHHQQQQPQKQNGRDQQAAPDAEIFMVPIFGYDNYIALSKFAEYLDSTSGALQDVSYRLKRAQLMVFKK